MNLSKVQIFFAMSLSAFFGGFMALSAYFLYVQPLHIRAAKAMQDTLTNRKTLSKTQEFQAVTQRVRPAVVHIKITKTIGQASYMEEREEEDNENGDTNFFGAGSGVIISSDGYIVTNNHVIENAYSLEVVLPDKRSFKARIIGADMATDLALLKIEGKNLPTARLASAHNSVEIGDWVLAIGNPFNLTASVTAGIVSGKGRKINLLKHDVANQKNALESFIQTDAATNPGNSGGALVNMKGEVVGINTAITTHTGYYTGFSFAIPVAIVHKVVGDLKQFGETKRPILGVKLVELTSKLAEKEKLKELKGVFVEYVADGSSASVGGLKGGDVVLMLAGKEVNSVPEFNAQIALHAPGEEIWVTFLRKGKIQKKLLLLKDTIGNVPEKKKDNQKHRILGAEFGSPTKNDLTRLRIDGGVKVLALSAGKLQDIGIKTGFIITTIDGKKMRTPEDAIKTIQESKQKGRTITIEGYYWGEGKAYYALGW